MKRIYALIVVSVVSVLLSCCTKESVPYFDKPTEIVISMGPGLSFDLDTKASATAISDLKSKTVYWGATTGGNSAGSTNETVKWTTASATTTSAGKINTGKYQTLSATTYNYYVSNANFTTAAANVIATIPNNSTDYVAGRLYGNNTATPTVTLAHVFARTGSLTATGPTGSTVTVSSWSIVGKSAINGTAGTYNIRTGAWATTTATLSSTAITGSSDYYLIPGTYTITCNFTYSHGDYSNTFSLSGDVVLAQGKINNITANISEKASQIVLSTSVTAWSANAVSFNI